MPVRKYASTQRTLASLLQGFTTSWKLSTREIIERLRMRHNKSNNMWTTTHATTDARTNTFNNHLRPRDMQQADAAKQCKPREKKKACKQQWHTAGHYLLQRCCMKSLAGDSKSGNSKSEVQWNGPEWNGPVICFQNVFQTVSRFVSELFFSNNQICPEQVCKKRYF